MNLGLLIFNLLPIYPLDGGQILQALLWFLIGRGPSLLAVCEASAAGAVAGSATSLLERHGVAGQVRVLEADLQGVAVSRAAAK